MKTPNNVTGLFKEVYSNHISNLFPQGTQLFESNEVREQREKYEKELKDIKKFHNELEELIK